MLMAAGRLNIPAVVVTGGPMDTGCFRGRKVCYTDLIEAEGLVKKEDMGLEDLKAFEQVRQHRPGRLRLDGYGELHEYSY